MLIHPQAQAGFARAAAAYERGRPDYPPSAVGWLASHLRLGPGKLVVDLGAGTGKLTRQLVPFGARVLAVEPVAEMASQLRLAVAGVEVLAATAADTGLASGTVDAVTAGQSFQWFADQPSLGEIHRILRPRGRFGLVWNRRDSSSLLWEEISELIHDYRRGSPDHSSGEWRRELQASRLFGSLESRCFGHWQWADREQLIDRVLSLSFIGVLGAEEQAELRRRLAEIADRYQPNPSQPISLRYRTEVFACSAC
ncbi:MAG TPA: methyltransferase domain-containing protein [Candidatus Dormibacteraeota bacterium]|jgi:SAM-dependent methyltransferase|nr:methyltransferase domain-containing protein [Candidatus Dormibacteraeota bacterium]